MGHVDLAGFDKIVGIVTGSGLVEKRATSCAGLACRHWILTNIGEQRIRVRELYFFAAVKPWLKNRQETRKDVPTASKRAAYT